VLNLIGVLPSLAGGKGGDTSFTDFTDLYDFGNLKRWSVQSAVTFRLFQLERWPGLAENWPLPAGVTTLI
jgi:hypothetical protein